MNTEDIVVCYFSYRGDEDCIKQSIRSIRANMPRSKIYVFDDDYHPCKNPDNIDCDKYIRTEFNRRGHLTGMECCLGMQACMAQAAEETGAKWVMKVDCDTMLVRTSFLENRYKDIFLLGWCICGRKSGVTYMTGPLYLIKSEILTRVSEHTKIIKMPTFGAEYPEDLVISMCCQFIDNTKCYLPYWGATNGYAGWVYREMDPHDDYIYGFTKLQKASVVQDIEDYKTLQVVTFGNRAQIEGDDREQHRVCAQAMEQACNFMAF